jgi:hypothetical protein
LKRREYLLFIDDIYEEKTRKMGEKRSEQKPWGTKKLGQARI